MRRLVSTLTLSFGLVLAIGCDSDSEKAPAADVLADTMSDAADTGATSDTAEPGDTAMPDVADTAMPDTQADTGDIAAFDTALLDTGTADTAVADTSAADTANTADTASAGACDNTADLATLAASEATLQADIQTCAFECIATGATCATSCIEREAGLSSDCSACFGDVISCTIAKCALQCLDASSANCTTCRDTNCTPAFAACSGVEQP